MAKKLTKWQIDNGYKFAKLDDAQFEKATIEVAKIIEYSKGKVAQDIMDYWVVVTVARNTWRKSQGLA